MAYTKAELIDQIFITISGGELSPATEVSRQEVEAHLGAAIAFAIGQWSKQSRDQSYREQRFLGRSLAGSTPIFALYSTSVDIDVVDGLDFRYCILPKGAMLLERGAGVGEVTPKGSLNAVVMAGSRTAISGLDSIESIVFGWVEIEDSGEKRIYFKNLPETVSEVRAKVAFDVTEMNGDDIVHVPSGLEVQIIDLCVNFFLNQRAIMADETADQRDTPPGIDGGTN